MKVFAPLFRYDYGIAERGDSMEKIFFVPALAQCSEVFPFWLEDHGFPQDIEGLQKSIIEMAEIIKPDLIFFIFMRDEIKVSTIQRLSEKWITVNWFCDDQWRFEIFTRFRAPSLSYNITVDKYSLTKYAEIGCKNVILSQWAATQEFLQLAPCNS